MTPTLAYDWTFPASKSRSLASVILVSKVNATLLPVRGPWATTGGTVPGGVAPGSCDPDGDDDGDGGDGTAAGIRTDVLGPTGPPSPAAVHPASTNAI